MLGPEIEHEIGVSMNNYIETIVKQVAAIEGSSNQEDLVQLVSGELSTTFDTRAGEVFRRSRTRPSAAVAGRH